MQQCNSSNVRGPKSHRGRSFACILLGMSGLAAGAFGAPTTAPASGVAKQGVDGSHALQGERMAIVTGRDEAKPMRVVSPDAFTSDAFPTAGYPGVLASSAPRYVAYGEVVLIAESREAAEAAVDSIRNEFSWLNGRMLVESPQLPGVFTLNTRTVRHATRVAELLNGRAGIENAMVNFERPRRSLGGGDPAMSAQWHIQNFSAPLVDHRIQQVHDMGVTGAGTVVGVLEAHRGNFTSPYDPASLADPSYDFSDVVHTDLFANFNQSLSQITDPFQVDVSHETAVAGLIGAVANNGLFGRGVAFNTQLVALRNGSALETAEAWSHELQEIDIINNSWGPVNEMFPPDFPRGRFPIADEDFEVIVPGVTTGALPPVERLSLERGVTMGRNGKGRLYVMAAGNASHFQGWARFLAGNAISLPQHGLLDWLGTNNGDETDFELSGADALEWSYSGMMGDRTEYSGQTTHPFTLSIAAVGENNERAGYSTMGTAVLAAGYSRGGTLPQMWSPQGGYEGGSSVGRGIATTWPMNFPPDVACAGPLFVPGLTCSFGGTSAAAPIASGIFALMLEANPNLGIRDIQHIIQRTSTPINFDPAASYWPTLFGFGQTDPDDPNTQNPTFWQVNSADVLHSDEYGFGVIDAEAAVEMAATWTGVPKLHVLDTGLVTDLSVTVPDAEFVPVRPAGDPSAPKLIHQLVPGASVAAERPVGAGTITGLACIRENFVVETVELTITVEGAGAGDLFIVLESPRGSISPLAIPRSDSTYSISPTDPGQAYTSYSFTTYKHWGELSGGTWNLYLRDFRPDEDSPEGDLPDEDDPGEEHVTLLGPLGLPGAAYFGHDEKTLVSFQLKIYGTNAGLPPTIGCPPPLTRCPGDLDANGIVDSADLQLFLAWYLAGDPLADMNGDGRLTFDDIAAFRAIWTPGFCGTGGMNVRPVSPPGGSMNRPVVRPV